MCTICSMCSTFLLHYLFYVSFLGGVFVLRVLFLSSIFSSISYVCAISFDVSDLS